MEFSELEAKSLVSGVLPDQLVEIITAQKVADNIAMIYFKDERGQIFSNTYTLDEISQFSPSTGSSRFTFEAKGDDFKLTTEAMRMQLAGLFDPMAAVNSSDLEPLPHQIRAVYKEFLPRVPLRFLLADDPGAGKTIMAGLYIKELILRGYLKRCLIVVPGGLLDQWKQELFDKFGLSFQTLTRSDLDNSPTPNPFVVNNFMIARMDQLSKRDDQVEKAIKSAYWDLVIVDEAHRMSAHYSSWKGEPKETRRFKLGRLLSNQTVNLLLMTATPHAGNDQDFELFLSLLDQDRFEGKRRNPHAKVQTDGLMRRMVKEDLLTFAGKPLFPERIAETVEYKLSPAELELYESVTEYVREEMNRAEKIVGAGENKKRNNIGFALTVLQRRLASSPRAIMRSLERREQKLKDLLARIEAGAAEEQIQVGISIAQLGEDVDFEDIDDEMAPAELEALENNENLDLLTASRSANELRTELEVLGKLVVKARLVHGLQEDKKWLELQSILTHSIPGEPLNEARKFIVFSEHKDTLDYLREKMTSLLGEGAVVAIHGGNSRDERTKARESFTQNPLVQVLVATDAAGEGLNLQRAHLMVNYDLPWNPNRIEQRFGRIHRIGQTEVCRLWNLIAADTREGDVFKALLSKIQQQSVAYNGNIFNVLGQGPVFNGDSLKDLLIKAIKYGSDPAKKAEMNEVIDAGVAAGLDELKAEQALYEAINSSVDVDQIRQEMEELQTRRLQPGFIEGFFTPAFKRLAGSLTLKETGRFEIRKVPQTLLDFANQQPHIPPLASAYERVTFSRSAVKVDNQLNAHLIAPGSALMTAVVEKTIQDLSYSVMQGAILVDRSEKQSNEPAVLFALQQEINNSKGEIVDRHFDFIEVTSSGAGSYSNTAPYIDYESPNPSELELIKSKILPGIDPGVLESRAREIALEKLVTKDKPALKERISAQVAKVRMQVVERLDQEITYWHNEHTKRALENNPKSQKEAAKAEDRAKELKLRKEKRLQELDKEEQLMSGSPFIRTAAIIVPSSLLYSNEEERIKFAKDQEAIKEVERRAVDLVLQVEKARGREPEEMPRNNKGFDIISRTKDGHSDYIEVKGRIEGSDTFLVTSSEISFGKTQGTNHRLAIVKVSKAGAASDELRYVKDPFADLHDDSKVASVNLKWDDYWKIGIDPLDQALQG
jgi:superfamily II DNA or RNA helicase